MLAAVLEDRHALGIGRQSTANYSDFPLCHHLVKVAGHHFGRNAGSPAGNVPVFLLRVGGERAMSPDAGARVAKNRNRDASPLVVRRRFNHANSRAPRPTRADCVADNRHSVSPLGISSWSGGYHRYSRICRHTIQDGRPDSEMGQQIRRWFCPRPPAGTTHQPDGGARVFVRALGETRPSGTAGCRRAVLPTGPPPPAS